MGVLLRLMVQHAICHPTEPLTLQTPSACRTSPCGASAPGMMQARPSPKGSEYLLDGICIQRYLQGRTYIPCRYLETLGVEVRLQLFLH